MAKRFSFDEAISADIKGAAADSFIDNLKLIKIEDIEMNEDNFYELSEIDELAEDIERQGLIHNLAVEKMNSSGKYLLISGHRRLTAIKQLAAKGKWASGTVPCFVSTIEKLPDEHRLDLIMLNHSQRKYSDADIFREHTELKRIIESLEESGMEFKGRMREVIAEKLNVSPAQVGKIENIKNNANADVISAVERGELSISVANEIAKCNDDLQTDIMYSSPNKAEIKSADIKAKRNENEKKSEQKSEKSVKNDEKHSANSEQKTEKFSSQTYGNSTNSTYDFFTAKEISFLKRNLEKLGFGYLKSVATASDKIVIDSIVNKLKGA